MVLREVRGRPLRPGGPLAGAPEAPPRELLLAGLAEVAPYGDTSSITLYVGRYKGQKPHNRSGVCSQKPRSVGPHAIRNAFRRLRTQQLGRTDVSGTAVLSDGWFLGRNDPAVVIDVAHVEVPREKTWPRFCAHMHKVADALARRFCQDTVLVVHHHQGWRWAAGVAWNPPSPAASVASVCAVPPSQAKAFAAGARRAAGIQRARARGQRVPGWR